VLKKHRFLYKETSLNLLKVVINMFLQAVPPPIPPPPPPGLPLENEIILLILGMIYGVIVLYKKELRRKTKMKVVLDENLK
jgi:hypothetical protein